MTDITQVTEALELLTTKHVTEMAVKADQTAVTEAVEAAKALADKAAAAVQAELESAKAVSAELTIKHEELEAKFAAMPTIQKEVTPMSNTFEKGIITNGQGQEMFGKSYNTFAKSVATGSDVAGGRVDAQSPYFILEQRSIFRGEATVMNTTAGAIKLPNISGVSWAKENVVIQDGSRSAGGSLASADLIVNNWTTENAISLPALEDIQDFDGMMVKLIAQKLAAAENAEAVAVLKAASITDVATGSAAALPTAANIVGKLNDMIASVGSAYLPTAKFYVSRALYSAIASSNNTTLNFDPATKLMTLSGYPVVVVDVLDAGNVANHVSGYFGAMDAALVMAARKTLDISRMDQTRPGSMTYFGDARFSFAGWDIDTSIVRLKTKV
jgi:HK97 family phage major capsid protein